MNDVIVEDGADLMRELYEIPKNFYNRHRSDFVYRGVANHAWGLQTSLIRLRGDYVKIEKPLLPAFRKYAEPGCIPSDNLWVRLL
jgi:hypothetical protein